MAKGRRLPQEQSTLYERVGNAIRRTRGSRNQQVVADAIGVDQSTLSDYETARTRIPLDVLVAIEEALGLPQGKLFVEAGLVTIGDDVLDRIRLDPTIDDARREFIIDAYERGRAKFLERVPQNAPNRSQTDERLEAMMTRLGIDPAEVSADSTDERLARLEQLIARENG